jgi:hypothetical protein
MKRLVGFISVAQSPTHITIEGLPGDTIARDIADQWSTSRINTYMFAVLSNSKLIFPKFFMIDVWFVLQELLASQKCRTSKRAIQKVIDEVKEKTWLKDLDREITSNRLNFARLNEINWAPLPHQRDFLDYYNKTVPQFQLNGMMLAAAPGSGKTITCLYLGACLEADVQIFICPKPTLERVWEATLRDNLVGSPEYWVSKVPQEPAPKGLRYYAFHYEALDRALELAKSLKGKKVFIALDESHNFNDIGSNRTAMFVKLCKDTAASDVVWSSGTPIKAMGAEAIPFLSTIDPFFTQDAMERFKKIFGKDAKRANDILCHRIGLVSFKVQLAEIQTTGVDYLLRKIRMPQGEQYTLENIGNQMRAFIEERMKFYTGRMKEYEDQYKQCLTLHEQKLKSATEKENFARYRRYIDMIRKGYDPIVMKEEVMYCNRYELQQIIPSLPADLRKPFKSVRSIIKYLKLKVMGEALARIVGRQRIQCHVDLMDHVPFVDIVDGAKKKTIIFTSYVEVVEKLKTIITDSGYKPVVVYGQTSKDLASLVKKFFDDEDANPLIATFQSLSTGVPLIAASDIIMTNSPFRIHEREQAVARADRIGQDTRVQVHDLFLDTGSKPNISTRSGDILEWSRAAVEQIMGIEAPSDLEAALESMLLDATDLQASAESFVSAIQHAFPVIKGVVHAA